MHLKGPQTKYTGCRIRKALGLRDLCIAFLGCFGFVPWSIKKDNIAVVNLFRKVNIVFFLTFV